MVHSKKSEGPHSVQFNAQNLPSGIYFCKIQANGLEKTIKIIIQK
ncbi:T9SS type A sorting domain-containing protein [candidate division KSB1 bacterium]|nr:T9SS type A sorting domain-containing protein [candidate division KSB1 bacterium]